MDMDIITPEDESRRKRLKLSDDASRDEPSLSIPPSAPTPEDAQTVKEAEVGITKFVSPDTPGFLGIVKKRCGSCIFLAARDSSLIIGFLSRRYTDFLVNEILLDGTVLHLKSLSVPSSSKPEKKPEKKPDQQPTAADTGNGAAEKDAASAEVEVAEFTVCLGATRANGRSVYLITWILGFGGRQKALG
jgi:tRNA pseudouridine13 synthase